MELDGVGPVDNRPSTDKLHQIVKKKEKKKKWHVTCDTWHGHMTRDTWHMTCDMWQVGGHEHSLKISAP